MSGLLDTIIGSPKEEVCQSPVATNCDEENIAQNIISDYKILYPKNASDIPFGGGAILKLNAASKIHFPIQTASILNLIKEVNSSIAINKNVTKDIRQKIDVINEIKVATNNFLYKLGKPPFPAKYKLSLYMSINKGDSNGDKPFCAFKYVPIQVLKQICKNIKVNPVENLYGVSGYSFEELSNADATSDSDIAALAFELFPIYNLTPESIFDTSNINFAGFYTSNSNGDIFLKLPDLSGMNSISYGRNDFYQNGENYSISFNFTHGSLNSKVSVNSPKLPIASRLITKEIDFDPSSNEFELQIDTLDVPASNISRVYLSVVNPEVSAPRTSTNSGDFLGSKIVSSKNSLEEFTFPALTVPFLDKRPFVEKEECVNYIAREYAPRNLFFDTALAKDEAGVVDIPISGFNAFSYLGLKNRAPIVFGSQNDIRPYVQNDSVYFSSTSPSVYRLMNSILPKVGGSVPNAWIRSKEISQSDDNVVAKFSTSELLRVFKKKDGKIDPKIFSHLNNKLLFRVYIEDTLGQICKSYGELLSIESQVAVVTSLQPSGYSDSKVIAISMSNRVDVALSGFGLANVLSVDLINSAGTLVKRLTNGVGDVIINQGNDAQFGLSIVPSSLGISAGEYSLIINTEYGNGIDSDAKISLSETELSPQKDKIASLQRLEPDEITANVTSGVVIDPTNSTINLKSKGGKFSNGLTAYIATHDKESLKSFCPEDVALQLSHGGSNYYIVPFLEFEVSNQRTNDFYFSSRKRASIKIIGKYSKYNLASLIGNNFSIVLLSDKISTFTVGGNISNDLIRNYFSIISFGDDKNSGIVSAPKIVGCAAEYNKLKIKQLQSQSYVNYFKELQSFSDGLININKQADYFYIMFTGPSPERVKYKFNFGTKNITSKLVGPISTGSKDLYMAKFKNVDYRKGSVVDIYIDAKSKDLKYSYSSKTLTLKSSFQIQEEFISKNDETGYISILKDSDNPFYFPIYEKSGVLYRQSEFGPMDAEQLSYNLFSPVSITFSKNTMVSIQKESGEIEEDLALAGSQIDDVEIITSNMSLLKNSPFASNEYVYSPSSKNYILFSSLNITNPATVLFDRPTIIEINKSAVSAGSKVTLTTGVLQAGKEITLTISNTPTDFAILINDIAVKPVNKTIDANGNTSVTTIITEEVAKATVGCPTICLSTENASYLGAELQLGSDAMAFLGSDLGIIKSLKERGGDIPDVGESKDKLRDNPLRFLNVILDSASVPTELINSFCDFSYELTANLQLSLSTFKAYLVPIKVIFCIIDVICSLINPVKLVRAIIRLFRCIIDLLALIPALSVPIMFLQLALHLLELLKCVFPKIQEHIITINNIIDAISLLVQRPDQRGVFSAIASLEDSLDTYIKNVEIDLQFLDPVTQIFAIFLELLESVFTLSCFSGTDDDGEPSCGIDPTMLAGIVAGTMAPEDDILPNILIPVIQPYTNESIEDASSSGNGSKPFIEASPGDVVAEISDSGNYLDDLDVNLDSLRPTSAGLDFFMTFAPTVTKTRRRRKNIVRFLFNQKGDGGKRIIDPEQTLDAPLVLLTIDNTESKSKLKVRNTSKGNFVSPIDGYHFMTINDTKGSIKPLELTFNLPEYAFNEATGELIQTGERIITRTFDDIPSMAIMDEEFNLYFVDEEGVTFKEKDGYYYVDNILSKMMNQPAAPKLKFTKEETIIDTNDDDVLDEEVDDVVDVYDFPQIYFVDMRQCKEQIQQACYNTSINSFMLDNQTDEIKDIVEFANKCVDDFVSSVRLSLQDIRDAISAGKLPTKINISTLQEKNEKLAECINESIDDVCKFAVNSLSTTFKIEDDTTLNENEQYPDVSIQGDIAGDEEGEDPYFLGAAEYASGIGDSIQTTAGENVSVLIIPRDNFNQSIVGDFTSKIVIDIISDDTSSAVISNIIRQGEEYRFFVTASNPGIVRIRARVCQRTIQAITYAGINFEENLQVIDCIDDVEQMENVNVPLGALTKVDRILNIVFTRRQITGEGISTDDSTVTTPQTFGTELVN